MLLLLFGCGEAMTRQEAAVALDEALASAQAEVVVGEVVEVSTAFTLGQAVEDAAEELRAWWASQAACAVVTREGATVVVDFGDLGDACTWEGRTWGGVYTLTVERAEADDVLVTHSWEAFTDGTLTVDGIAEVTWAADAGTRRVVHALDWTDGDRAFTGSGDRTQALLDPEAGLAGGIVVSGERAWTSDAGDWRLDIDAVEMRGMDPVPQAGVYTLENPAGKSATLEFSRLDEDTIAVVLTSGRWSRTWEVGSGAG